MTNTLAHQTPDAPTQVHLSYRELQALKRANNNAIALSGAGAIWLNTLMVSGSIGLMIYVGFTKELFFANERHSEFVFAITMCIVLLLWYLHVAIQLLKIRRIEFFANENGAYILANHSRHDYFFIPWSRVQNHEISRGYYNGSAAAITLHTDYTVIPEAIVERGSSHGILENDRAHFSVIPRCFVRYEDAESRIAQLRGASALSKFRKLLCPLPTLSTRVP
ncbi:MAG: hypothetical protein ACPGSC_05630 [Granulosicoccaceae bacterium]